MPFEGFPPSVSDSEDYTGKPEVEETLRTVNWELSFYPLIPVPSQQEPKRGAGVVGRTTLKEPAVVEGDLH